MNLNPTIQCRQAARLLSERLDAPLPTGQRLRLAGHLVVCDACRQADRQMAFLSAAVKAREAAPASPPDPPT